MKKNGKHPKPIRKANKSRQKKTGVIDAREADAMEVQAMLIPLLDRAAETGSWLAAVFAPNGNHVELQWLTQEFPPEDFTACVKLLEGELQKERARIENRVARTQRKNKI